MTLESHVLRLMLYARYIYLVNPDAVTFIMMSWISQIGLFSSLSLRQLIYAWVPRGRLQLSSFCVNLRLLVLGNKLL